MRQSKRLPAAEAGRFYTSTIVWRTWKPAKPWDGRRFGTRRRRKQFLNSKLWQRLQRDEAVAQIIERFAGGLETLGQGAENVGHVVFVRQAMVARGAETGAADFFVITYVRRASPFGAHANAIRKDAGQKERVVAHVGADKKAGDVIGRFQRREHIHEIIGRLRLA